MKSLFLDKILSVTAHPDDMEMHHAGLLEQANSATALIATKGESTTLNFSDTPVDEMAEKRRLESERSLAFYGFRGLWLDLADGELMKAENIDILTEQIAQATSENNITTLVSMGCRGFCQHTDHIATHIATVRAQDLLFKEHKKAVPILALDMLEGEMKVPVSIHRKMAGLALHASQFETTNGKINENFWSDKRQRIYGSLQTRESYTVILPKRLP